MDSRDLDLVRTLQACTMRIEGGEYLSGTEIAAILNALTDREVAPGGPYRNAEDGSLDIGTNLVIERFLRASEVRLPALGAHIERALQGGALSSGVLDRASLEEAARSYLLRDIVDAEGEVSSIVYDPGEEAVLRSLRACMERRFLTVGQEVKDPAAFLIERTIRGNADKQMSLMAEYMRRALKSRGSIFSDDCLGELGFANACFWASFIVYDDFWDEDEAAEPRLLPAANLLARNFVRTFSEFLPDERSFAGFFHAIMDTLDAANAWETVACRMRREGGRVFLPEELPAYGDFSIKFYPAAGHIMGPVAMLMQLGYAVDSEEVRSLVAYFEHYLVAMQLNDDAHDWREDLERGHISTVVSVLLDAWREAHPERAHIDLAEDMPELEQLFWFKTLDVITAAVLQRTARARSALEKLTFLEDLSPLMRFVDRNEAIAREAMRERERGDEFLAAFVPVGVSTDFRNS